MNTLTSESRPTEREDKNKKRNKSRKIGGRQRKIDYGRRETEKESIKM